MRIAHVTSGLDRYAAGIGAAVSALSAEQLLSGNDVRVFGLSSRAWLEGDRELWRGAPAQAMTVRCPPRAFGYAPELIDGLLQFDPDVVHLHGLWMYPGIAVWRWHRRTGKSYVYSAHGMLSPVALRFSPFKKQLARALFQNRALADATVLHATTEKEAEEFVAVGLRNNIAVVPLGIHPSPVPANAFTAAPRKLLYLGRLHPVKGLDNLIEAWARLEGRFPGWVLELVGPDEAGYGATLRELARRLGVQRISISAAVYGTKRDERLAAAEIFVLPTRSENFSLTVAESLLMQTPVVATRGAPWPGLVVETCGWWIDEGVESLTAGLAQAMALDDHERIRMGQRGRAWMLRDYTWSSISRRMEEVYRKAHRNVNL